MSVRILSIDARRPDPDRIREAAEILRKGGIVALPTETVYGLAADPGQSASLEALGRLKGRPAGKPFPLLFSRLSGIRDWVTEPWPEPLQALAKTFWPGPLTVILRGREDLAVPIRGPGNRIALRVTSHPVARSLIDRYGGPITGTSANRSGGAETVDPQEVCRQLGEGLELLLDGGRSPGGPSSTIVDLTRRPAKLLRPGPIDLEALERILPGGII